MLTWIVCERFKVIQTNRNLCTRSQNLTAKGIRPLHYRQKSAFLFRAIALCSFKQEYLYFLLVKHSKPLQVDHVGQPLAEGQAVLPDLFVQPVVRHQMDVGDPVGAGDRNVLSTRLQLNHLQTQPFSSPGKLHCSALTVKWGCKTF